MAVKQDKIYEKRHNCLTTDLTGDFLADTDFDLGSTLHIYDAATNELVEIHKLHDADGSKEWYKLGTGTIGSLTSTVADGDNATLGAKADAPATTGDTTAWSVIAMLKGIYNKLGAVVLAAGTAIIGQVGIDQTTDETTNKVRTDGVTKDTYATTELAASGVIKASEGKLYGLAGINDSENDQYLQVFESATVPANGVVPIIVLEIPAKSNFSIDFGIYGYALSTGISWSNSSTLATKTVGSADVWLNAIYI